MVVATREKIAVDLYCGGGGTTTGMQQAAKRMGLKLRCVAVNHNIFAIATHSTNHPDTKHFCMSVEDVSPRDAVPDGFLDLLWASLECTHHSNARGGAPMNDQSRSSAYDLLRWCRELDVETVMIENVREFLTWGPLYPDDYHVVKLRRRPIPERKGEFFRDFIAQLRGLGYTVEWRILNAADFGDPTSRRRLFVQAQKRKPIVWPEPTHGTKERPHRTAREIINWDLKGKSIFGRSKPLAPNTMRRILAGLEKFGGEKLKPWLVVLRNHADSRSLDLPVPTLCGSGEHFGVAEPFITPYYGNSKAVSVDDPLGTVTSMNKFGLAEPFLVQYFGGKDAVSVDQPLPTVCANYEHYALCEPFLVGAGGPAGAGEPQSVDQPLGTVMTENHRALCEPYIINISHQGKAATDAGHIYSTDQPLPTVITEQEFALCEPFIVPQFGEREGQAPRTHSVDEPLPTVTGHGAGALVQPYLVEYHGGPDGDKRTRSLDEPLPTQDCSNRFGLAEPFLTPYYGRSTCASVDDPLDTVTTRDTFGLCQPEVCRDKGGFYLDIRFRMLTPGELAAAMSFPKGYHFHGGREQSVKQIGNAVPVELATALCMAVLGEAE